MKGISEEKLKERHSESVQSLEAELNEQKKIFEYYKKTHGDLEVFFNRVEKAIKPYSAMPKLYKPEVIKKGDKDGKFIKAVIQISDGHMGAVQEPNEIEGFNIFNPKICENRQMYHARSFIDWIQVQRFGYTINDCHVIVTGDLISGDIHEELKITNAFPVPEQIIKAGNLLAAQLMTIASHFDTVTVDFVTEDNHARLTLKPQMKQAGVNSYNYLVGYIAKLLVAKQKNIDFRIHPVYEQVIEVNGRQYLTSHGHGVMGWGGIPWYGIERKVGKESQARLQVIMKDLGRAKQVGFHKQVFGHWHIAFDMPLYSCSGSVSGTDAYDHKCGRYATPSQPAWLVSANHGEFNRINFDLGHINE